MYDSVYFRHKQTNKLGFSTYLNVDDVVRVAAVEHWIGDIPVNIVRKTSRIVHERSSFDRVDGRFHCQHHRHDAEEHGTGRRHDEYVVWKGLGAGK